MEIINGVVQSESGGSFGSPVTKTISSGVVSTGGSSNLTLAAETGTTDTLTQITGMDIGDRVLIQPDTGDTITVADGANLDLQGVDFVMNDSTDVMELLCTASGKCKEISRASNG